MTDTRIDRRAFMRGLLATTALVGVSLPATRFASGGPVPMDSYLVGEAGTACVDFNFNTCLIVSDSTIAMHKLTVSIPEGAA